MKYLSCQHTVSITLTLYISLYIPHNVTVPISGHNNQITNNKLHQSSLSYNTFSNSGQMDTCVCVCGCVCVCVCVIAFLVKTIQLLAYPTVLDLDVTTNQPICKDGLTTHTHNTHTNAEEWVWEWTENTHNTHTTHTDASAENTHNTHTTHTDASAENTHNTHITHTDAAVQSRLERVDTHTLMLRLRQNRNTHTDAVTQTE